MSPLVVIPTFMRQPSDLEVVLATLESVRRTEPEVDIKVVDDCSPAHALWEALITHTERLNFVASRNKENVGFSHTVNVGLRDALQFGQDAVLMNSDIECMTDGWVDLCVNQKDTLGRPASAVGALLIYPLGLIQHAGIYFSMLTRTFDHRYRFAPSELPEAHLTFCCPVTGAFQYIRHECLESVGLYDEEFRMGWEDVDYCLRVFESGRECIYQPKIKALHHESLFRGRADGKLSDWQDESIQVLMRKHQNTNMSRYIPEMV